MPMHKLPLIVALAALPVLSGCVINVNSDEWEEEENWRTQQSRNERMIAGFELGISRASVEADLGDADFVDAFERDGETINVLFYRTHHRHSDGKTTRDETTPLIFRDGRLSGYGQSALEFMVDD